MRKLLEKEKELGEKRKEEAMVVLSAATLKLLQDNKWGQCGSSEMSEAQAKHWRLVVAMLLRRVAWRKGRGKEASWTWTQQGKRGGSGKCFRTPEQACVYLILKHKSGEEALNQVRRRAEHPSKPVKIADVDFTLNTWHL
jgi:hypothetical protein